MHYPSCHVYRLGGVGVFRGGSHGFLKTFRGGSAVIDKHNGGDQTKKKGILGRAGTPGDCICKYFGRICRWDSKPPTIYSRPRSVVFCII